MKKSNINVEVSLDEGNIPEKIRWQADDHPNQKWMESKAVSISIWDSEQQDSLSLDLWTKDMNTDEMKRFYINMLGAASNTILNSTGDEFMAEEIKNLCEKLVEYLKFQ
ncbi:gliding motility protein GldC [Reichenbachiella sp. MALMAid0571]|uniref:gliding motility protein GldC n=1 Tax=Reichenbachiella sp. MALMAid0571 TaxID=3143939 RepID=UPI0032DE7B89